MKTLSEHSYKELQGATDVQNRLDTGRDDCDGSPAERCQIGADVQTWRNDGAGC